MNPVNVPGCLPAELAIARVDRVRQPLPVAEVGGQPVGEPRAGAEHVVHHQQLVVVRVAPRDAEVPDVDVNLGRGRVADDLLGRRPASAAPSTSGLPRSDFFQSAVSASIFFTISSVLKSPTTDDRGEVRGEASSLWNAFTSAGGELLDDLLLAQRRPAERVVAVHGGVEQTPGPSAAAASRRRRWRRAAARASARARRPGRSGVMRHSNSRPRPRSVSGVSTLSDPPPDVSDRLPPVSSISAEISLPVCLAVPSSSRLPMSVATPALSAGSRSRTSATSAAATTIGSRWSSSRMTSARWAARPAWPR